MDQSRATNALAPFVALAKSANSPRAAADLVTQATSAANTYVFAELLQQPNIQQLARDEKYGSHLSLLQHFAWGTLESYRATPGLPALSDAQLLKLRHLSLISIASQRQSSAQSASSNLSYRALCGPLELSSTIDLEHLVTEAIYSGLVKGTLNPAAQTVVITSVAPLRDLAPGSVADMIAELQSWSGRCTAALASLETEIGRVRADAEKRARREAKLERQIRAVADAGEKTGATPLAPSKAGHNARGAARRSPSEENGELEDEDMMDVDEGGRAGGARKKSSGGSSLLSRIGRGGGSGSRG